MQVDYTNSFGDEIKFDENGDPAAMYDLVIWQLSPRGEMEFTTIGKFDETATVGEKKLHIQRQNFSWSGNQTDVGLRRNCDGALSHTFPTAAAALCACVRCRFPFCSLAQVPLSVCSSICPPGTRKAIRPNFPICCHDCVACTAGEISNQSGKHVYLSPIRRFDEGMIPNGSYSILLRFKMP